MDCSTATNENNNNTITLRHHVIINQMAAATGCTHEQAKQFLIAAEWRLEAAINSFFNEHTMPIPCCKFSELMTPANTPATPPNFPDTLLAFGKLSASNTTSTAGTDNQIVASTTHHPLSSSPLNMNMMMMDGTA